MLYVTSYGGNKMSLGLSPLCIVTLYTSLYSDASLEGWGGTDEVTHVGGRWTEDELTGHINALELQAAYLTLQALGSSHTNVQYGSCWTTTATTAYINKMGGTHTPLSVMLFPKPFGNGQSPGISGCLLHMFLVHKT